MSFWRRWLSIEVLWVGVGCALGLTAVAGLVTRQRAAPVAVAVAIPSATLAGWRETGWPLPADPWWPTKAFTCAKAVCGVDITLYVRAKIGFCNCKTGVADDEELERIGDFGVLASGHAPTADGRPILVRTMRGRSRPYTMASKAPAPAAGSALLIGYNDRCDAVVATALVGSGDPQAVEARVLEFLAGPGLWPWTEATLGL